jgi:hypothetical protein
MDEIEGREQIEVLAARWPSPVHQRLADARASRDEFRPVPRQATIPL